MKLRQLAISAMLATMPLMASASIQNQVDQMFNGMVNTTVPGAYQTATRGVVTGGSIVLRDRISTANLISITPPSAKAGCGGINLYSGSFSFINGDEFVALMRNIAANAAGVVSGFAFDLALDAMDAQTAGVIRNLANKIQSLNQMFSNSCQIASGLVTDAKKAYMEASDLSSAMTAFGNNVATDFFSAKSTADDSPANRIVSAGKATLCKEVGNVLWCAMQKTNLVSQILFGSDENAEFIMSMVGSYIVTPATDDKGGKNFTVNPLPTLIGSEGLKIFVEGTKNSGLRVYRCDNNDNSCQKPSIANMSSFDGLATRIVKDLQDNQVLEHLANGVLSPGDENRYAYLGSSRVGVNLVRIVQKNGAQAGYDYLNKYATTIAAQVSYNLIIKLLAITESGVTGLDMTNAKEALSSIKSTREQISSEYSQYVANSLKDKDADADAASMMEMAPPTDNGSLTQGSGSQSSGS